MAITTYIDASGNNPNNFTANQTSVETNPAESFGAVVDPNAANVSFTTIARSLYIGVSGNLSVTGVDGTSVLFTGLLSGSILPVQCIGTITTSTTVTNIIPLY